MDSFLYDNGLRHERVNKNGKTRCIRVTSERKYIIVLS